MTAGQTYRAWDKGEIAKRVASDIPEGWYVNLGIGLPTLVADHIPQDREVVLHSENGILGMGPIPTPDEVDTWLVNAGKENVTLVTGAALFHHADSFAMIRGGHLDLCVLGAFEVGQNGDLANWTTSLNDRVPAVGGAMDLSVGARNLWVMTAHTTKDGEAKLVERCSYPLTASQAVTRVYTDLAVLDISRGGFVVLDMVEGLTRAALQELTAAPLHFA
ncbi:3-oxoacid CoA-transferase subunit B [Arvimicrobium flavum]|uniref:3-oxoacid CoA-transferase subunit B n=1 Tax=Arvimicrobium flavum TaxID=3393320 RepID=UPI00237C249F|nr:3-oxoacid CoA-transferase subunit B [Mesorhizobium shangrilense]